MTIREATHDDLPALAQLFDNYRVFYRKTSDLNAEINFLSERMKNNDSKIYVAEKEDDLVGFVQLYPLFSSTRLKKLWLLNDLYVYPNFRGQGISLQLINRAKQLVKDSGACGMFLETEKTNTIGNNLYPKAGFKKNETSNFYEWNVD